LESALTMVDNELKYVATVRKEYASAQEVCCHPGQLSQVFLNLLVNAGHAMVAETLGEIVLRSRHDERFVYASVSDTGSGIPEELRERIFDPFFTTKEAGKGTGLGLSISSDIIKKHGGELLVESVVGSGTTFTVKLPCAPVEEM
jgi:two-component system, NtrC family, sensor kinase